MLIVCPSCASRYEIAEDKIGAGGRKVRCAACQTTWQIEAPASAADEQSEGSAPEPEPAADPPFPPAPSAQETAAELEEELRRGAAVEAETTALVTPNEDDPAPAPAAPLPARQRKPAAAARRPSTLAASILFSLAAAGALAAGLWQRERVVRAVPQFAGLFETVGLPVNIRGLAFSAVASELIQDAQGRFLVVEGDVTNITRTAVKVPPITVMVRGEDGKVLYSWTTEPPRPMLEPSELAHFRARLASPPETGRSVQVRFGGADGEGLASLR
jgi:predicted Zn finger-like uncharacterized protein